LPEGPSGLVGNPNAPAPGCTDYLTSTGTDTIVLGTTDTGNHCDDCATSITLPFPVSVYGQTFTTANVGSNGSFDLIGAQSPFTHGCLTLPDSRWTMAIFGYQDDLRTDNLGFTGCAAFPGGTCGVFTATTGSAPNRIFYVEWRPTHFADTTTSANFEVVFYENDTTHFDIIYGATSDSGSDETSGVQAGAAGPATTFSCGVATLTNGLKVTYTCQGASPTPTATASPTATPTATGSPGVCQFHVLIAYADIGGAPTTLPNQILAEPGVIAVDLFDAFSGTPTLQQLQQYNIVVPFSNNVYFDAVGMGNVLADYADTGGVVVGLNFNWFGPPFGFDGRWITGGYTPFNVGPTNFTTSCLGTYDTTHPLMQGIS